VAVRAFSIEGQGDVSLALGISGLGLLPAPWRNATSSRSLSAALRISWPKLLQPRLAEYSITVTGFTFDLLGLVSCAGDGMIPIAAAAKGDSIMFAKTTKTLVAALVLAGVSLSLATSASARVHHHQYSGSAGYGKIDSGYGPPRDWSEIQQGAVGGNSN
jgi:hypothetical protein